MSKKPKVSIIIPALNVADTIERCVNSALKQTYPDTEVIVIEGDSSDGTRFLLKQIEDRCDLEEPEKLKLFLTTFDNIATARNTGLSKATGKYVFWLEPTDYLAPDAVETYVENALRTGAEMIKNTCRDAMVGTITFDRVAYIRMILDGSISKDIAGTMFDKDVFHSISFDRRSVTPEDQAYMAICEKCQNVTLIRRNDLYHRFCEAKPKDAKVMLSEAVVSELTYEKYSKLYPIECEHVLAGFASLAVSVYFKGKKFSSDAEEEDMANSARLLLLNHELSIEKNSMIDGYTKTCVQTICRKNSFVAWFLKLFWKNSDNTDQQTRKEEPYARKIRSSGNTVRHRE